MNRLTKSALIILSAALIGSIVNKKINHNILKPSKALKKTKQQLKRHCVINGSWIYIKHEEMMISGVPRRVYKAGMSCLDKNNAQIEYDLAIDAYTGAPLHITPCNYN